MAESGESKIGSKNNGRRTDGFRSKITLTLKIEITLTLKIAVDGQTLKRKDVFLFRKKGAE